MAILTNNDVQDTFKKAISLLLNSDDSIMPDVIRCSLAEWFTWVAIHSASGNDIPVLRSLGLEPALASAQTIINVLDSQNSAL